MQKNIIFYRQQKYIVEEKINLNSKRLIVLEITLSYESSNTVKSIQYLRIGSIIYYYYECKRGSKRTWGSGRMNTDRGLVVSSSTRAVVVDVITLSAAAVFKLQENIALISESHQEIIITVNLPQRVRCFWGGWGL